MDKNKLEIFNLDLHQQQNGLRFHGHEVGSFLYGAGLYKALDMLKKKHNVKIGFKPSNLWGSVKNKLILVLYKILDKEKGRRFIGKFVNVPSIFYPKYTHILDGHKIVMWDGEQDIATKNILNDYKTLTDWETETSKLMREHIKQDDICLDIGASIGPLTLLMAKQAKEVIAVEPTERCFNYLCQNIEANGYTNVTPLKIAAWDKNELVKMPMNDPHPIYVNGICMDDWLEQHGYLKVDFIKIDVDGPEPKVLKGLLRTIKRNPQLKMVIEYYPKYILGAGCSLQDFADVMNTYFVSRKIPMDYTDGCWNLFCTRK